MSAHSRASTRQSIKSRKNSGPTRSDYSPPSKEKRDGQNRPISGCDSELPGDTVEMPAECMPGNTWVKLNIGGTMIETNRQTISALESEFLELLLDDDMATEAMYSPEDGVYRIDKDIESFQVFLNFGRNGKIYGVPGHISEEFLMHEIKFYKMSRKVKKAVKDYFIEKMKCNPVQVERVDIRELIFDKKHKHHNIYGVLNDTSICCFTQVPGAGICYKEVNDVMEYSKPDSKIPALFRARCLNCGLKICLADDELIGLDGWCHKCKLCLRCQDILCEDIIDTRNTRIGMSERGEQNEADQQGVEYVPELPESLLKKTVTVSFINDLRPVEQLKPREGPTPSPRLPKTPLNNNALLEKIERLPRLTPAPQKNGLSKSFSGFPKTDSSNQFSNFLTPRRW